MVKLAPTDLVGSNFFEELSPQQTIIFCEQDFLDAQPISNPERLMMASEMDMDEAEEEAMAIVASELGIKIGAKV